MATSTTPATLQASSSAPRRRAFGLSFLLSALSWAIFGLALDPLNLWWLTFVAWIPLFLSARDAGSRASRWPAALGATLGALPFWLFEQRWIADISAAGYVPFAVYLSMYSGLFVWITGSARVLVPRVPWWFSATVVWIGLETLRADMVLDGYPWYLAAQPLVESPIASALGVWIGLSGVSALVALLSSAAAHARGGSWLPLAVSGLIAGLVGTAAVVFRPAIPADGRAATIAAVQTNVPQSNKLRSSIDDLVQQHAELMKLTKVAAEAAPDVIAWPETMRPGQALTPQQRQIADDAGVGYPWDSPKGRVFLQDSLFAVELLELQKSLAIPVLVGEDYADNLQFTRRDNGRLDVGYDARYNSVFLIEHGEVLPIRYDKLFRTPFGETMPWIRAFPALESKLLALAAGGLKLDLAAGKGPVTFTLASGARLATPICFEVTVPSVCRQMVVDGQGLRRADILVNVTNDGWFGSNAIGKAQHAQLARWRCVELATPMIRAANTGISSAADSRGVPLGGRRWTQATGWVNLPALSLASDTSGVIVCAVPIPGEPTLYARTGNLIGPAGVGGLSAIVLNLLWFRYLKR